MESLVDLELLFALRPSGSNESQSDISEDTSGLFDDPYGDLWDFSNFTLYLPPPPATQKSMGPLVANQPQLESLPDPQLQANTIPAPVLGRTSTPNDAGGTSSSLPPISNIAQPIQEPAIKPAPAPLKRKRQSEDSKTKNEGRPEKKKKKGKRSSKIGSSKGGSSVPRSVQRRQERPAYYASIDWLINQVATIPTAVSGNSPQE